MIRLPAKDAYDKVAEDYDGSFNDDDSKAENASVRRQLLDGKFDRGRLVDLGCGTGFLLELIHPDEYIGVDISDRMLNIAREKFPNRRFDECPMESMRYILNNWANHVVCLFGSISYASAFETENEIRRVLAPGGDIFLMFYGPNYSSRPSYILNRHKIEVAHHEYTISLLEGLYSRFNPTVRQFGWWTIVRGAK